MSRIANSRLKRHKPLVASTPLPRTGWVRKPPRPKPRHRKDAGPDQATRELVLARDRWRCVACGRYIGGIWWSMQHRKARGQGGGNGPENLVTLCGSATSEGCHRIAEDRDREYNARGYWLHSWESPLAVPVMVFSEDGGVTAWLTADGRYSFGAPGGAT